MMSATPAPDIDDLPPPVRAALDRVAEQAADPDPVVARFDSSI